MNSDKTVRVCVPVCEKSFSALETACRKASVLGDLVELRLDCLDGADFQQASKNLNKLLSGLSRPAILTFRPAEQGGRRSLSREERDLFWSTQAENAGAGFWDIETELLSEFPGEIDWSRIICSHHDFEGIPLEMDRIYEAMAALPARVLKIAVQARDMIDCLPVFQLLDRARREGREMIAIAMGAAGVVTRILGPSRGAFLTYGALQEDGGTAPGQLTAQELGSLYRLHLIDEETLICGLVGLPVTHSVSPHMHNAAFDHAGINGVYLPFEVRDLAGFCRRMVHPQTREIDWNLRGLSVTAPHKSNVMDCLDWIDPGALQIGAVNTVVVEADRLLGYNTDAEGLIEPLLRKIGPLAGLRVAVLGAGGAARAAVWGLRQHAATVVVFVRNLEKGERFSQQLDVACIDLASASFAGYDVVINATQAGCFGEPVEQTPATAQQLTGAQLAYDLVYNPTETRFLREARTAGCETLRGLEMLVAQAILQFKLWTAKDASSSVMYSAASSKLNLSPSL